MCVCVCEWKTILNNRISSQKSNRRKLKKLNKL